MAKKITRGITDIKDINNQDFDTNNVNDLLSDGQYNYIHRKKGKGEEYHNLTDNIKTISSDNTDLLSVTNYNKTTNTALLSPKHDSQKEQVLESERNTVTIKHGTNGTDEKTKIDVNTNNVLTHNNLLSSSPLLTVEHQDGQDTTTIKAENLQEVLQQLYEAILSSGYSTIKYFSDTNFRAYEHRVVTSDGELSTLSFVCYNAAETVLTGELKQYLNTHVKPNKSISNGALTITNDGTNMKLINSAPSENVTQHATFTFTPVAV